jgi:hypothetical protein
MKKGCKKNIEGCSRLNRRIEESRGYKSSKECCVEVIDGCRNMHMRVAGCIDLRYQGEKRFVL